MPACEEVKSAKYQTRKSPAYHAGDCKDLTKKGKDGNYASKPDARGVYKWVKVSATRKIPRGTKVYDIHDNGFVPFRVEVYGKTVAIYEGTLPEGENEYDNMVYNDLLKKLTVKAVYVGESPIDSSMYIDLYSEFDKGNSILLHLSGSKYLYVGSEIYEFTMEDTFETYYSPIGSNDVPYPVVIGSQYVYFMLDHTFVSRDLFKAPMTAVEWADSSAYYYGFKDLTTGKKSKKTLWGQFKKKDIHKMKGFKMIQMREHW
jgi:hypothetical protein